MKRFQIGVLGLALIGLATPANADIFPSYWLPTNQWVYGNYPLGLKCRTERVRITTETDQVIRVRERFCDRGAVRPIPLAWPYGSYR